MNSAGAHVPEKELLLHATGELEGGEQQKVSTHVASCPQCATRISELSQALSEFSETQSRVLNGASSLRHGARSRLEARLAEAASRQPTAWRSVLLGGLRPVWRSGGFAAALALVAILVAARVWRNAGELASTPPVFAAPVPNAQLTPGVALSVTTSQICGDSREAATIPAILKAKVFQLYGVAPGQAGAYEVDYLITPELGGATDIRNLWPEPYYDTVWNAHVKDQLEDRLHQMVCRGDIDLATAQRAISTDWIAAYRQYFHADLPVAGNTSSAIAVGRRSLS